MGEVRMDKSRVVIMGAGPAGLTTAYHLIERGYDVTVIEMEHQVGGQCRTISHNGFKFDLGGHRFLSAYEDVLDLVKKLLGEKLVTVPRKSSILLNGNLILYPLNLDDVLRKMSFTVSTKALIDYLWEKVKNIVADEGENSFEDWTRKRFGRTLYEIYFGMYTEKVWGVPPKEISADWAKKRISSVNLMEVMKTLVGLKKSQGVFECKEFLYPLYGIGGICERLAESIVAQGGTILFGSQVSEVCLDRRGRVETVTYVRSGRHYQVSGDWFVTTIPLAHLISVVRPTPSKRILRISSSLRNRCLRFVALLVNRRQVTDNLWIFVPEKDYCFFRIQEMGNWSRRMVPEGQTVLVCEIACDRGDYWWNLNEKRIVNRCVDDLERLRLIRREEVLAQKVERLEYGYPLYELDYKEKLDILYEYLLTIPNLVGHGRQGLYRYDTMDHAMKTGMIAAEVISGDMPRDALIRHADVTEQF
jgi:protoporphyrinogen oxidase